MCDFSASRRHAEARNETIVSLLRSSPWPQAYEFLKHDKLIVVRVFDWLQNLILPNKEFLVVFKDVELNDQNGRRALRKVQLNVNGDMIRFLWSW